MTKQMKVLCGISAGLLLLSVGTSPARAVGSEDDSSSLTKKQDSLLNNALANYSGMLSTVMESDKSLTPDNSDAATVQYLPWSISPLKLTAFHTAQAFTSASDSEEEEAEESFGDTRDTYIDAGFTINDSQVHMDVLDTEVVDGKIVATVDITTVMKIVDEASGVESDSSLTDPHILELTPEGSGYTIVSDTYSSAPYESNAPEDENGKVQDFDEAIPDPGAPASDVMPSASTSTTADSSNAVTASFTAPSPDIQLAATTSEPRLNVTKAVAYALKWTRYPYAGDSKKHYNAAYPIYNNNCANFVSQVLDQSTWSYRQGNSLQQKNRSLWTPNLKGIRGASYTWSSPAYLISFAGKQYNAYRNMGNIWDGRAGDLLFPDWDPNGKADGTIDHSMFVTGRSSAGIPMITQKNVNRSHVPLTASIANAKKAGVTKIVWYGKIHK